MIEVNPHLAFSLIDQKPGQLLKAIKGYRKEEEIVSLERTCQPLSHILDELEDTKSLDVLQKSQFVDPTGIRTLFCIEGVFNGKNIRHHSYLKQKDEILLLPSSTFQVRSLIHRIDKFRLIDLRQIKLLSELLVQLFDDTPIELNTSQTYQRQRRNSKLVQPTTAVLCKSDDEPPNSDYKSKNNSSKITSSTQSSTYKTPKNNHMTGWSIEKTNYTNDNKQTKIVHHFSGNFLLKIRTSVRILARQTSKKSLPTMLQDGMTSLIADNLSTWDTNMLTRFIDDHNEEQARYS